MRAILGCGVAAVLMISAGLTADDKKDEKIDAKKLVGKWEPGDGKKDAKVTIEFTKDGKLQIVAEFNGKSEKAEGTYKLDGNKLDVTLKLGGQEQKETLTVLKLTDDELTTED